MDFRMTEQPRTIKIYNLLVGTNEFIGEGDAYIPPHTPACQPTVPILHRQIFRLASWLFLTVMRHRGILLKTIGVKPSMTWFPATRYLFLNLVRYQRMSPGCRQQGSIRGGTAYPG